SVFDRGAGYMLNLEKHIRGFQVLETGVIGGDAGGYFSHHWQSPEFTYKTKRVRLQGTSFFASPENYRVRMQIAVDDQPFTAYGTLWWRRDGSAAPAKQLKNQGCRLSTLGLGRASGTPQVSAFGSLRRAPYPKPKAQSLKPLMREVSMRGRKPSLFGPLLFAAAAAFFMSTSLVGQTGPAAAKA